MWGEPCFLLLSGSNVGGRDSGSGGSDSDDSGNTNSGDVGGSGCYSAGISVGRAMFLTALRE